jgi:hypothetical protein
MNKTLKKIMLASLLGVGGIATANAGLLTYQGVTFTSTWSGQVLTLEIDAASHTGDWARAKGLAALELDGIGDYAGVTVSAAPSGAKSWTTSSTELTAKGCSGGTTGQAGSRLCFFGQQIALGDNMVFSFTFSGNAIAAVDPHVKVEFVNSKGGKVGSLLSQTLPASPVVAANSGTGTGSQSGSAGSTMPASVPVPSSVPVPTPAPAPAPPTAALATATPVAAPAPAPAPDTASSAGAGAASAIVDNPVKEIPPAADLPSSVPLQTQTQTQTQTPSQSQSLPQGSTESGGPAAVPEPQGIALLLGGLGLMGLALRRQRRPRRG